MPKSLLSSESLSWEGPYSTAKISSSDFAQAVAVAGPVGRRFLGPVGDPDVVEAGAFQLPAHGRPDLAAALDVLDPELADGLVRMAQGEAVGGLGVGEAGGVEVELELFLVGPVDPAVEMLGLDFGAVDRAVSELAVDGVQVQTVGARDEGEGFLEIGPKLGRRCGLFRDGFR